MATKKSKKEDDAPGGPVFSANDLARFQDTIQQLDGLKPTDADDNRFFYGLNRNADRIASCLRSFRKNLKDNDEEYLEFEKKRFELAMACGAPQQQDGTIIAAMIKQTDKYNDGLIKLQKKYKDAITRQEKINEENNRLAEDEVIEDFKIYKIKYHLIPAQVNAGQRRKLSILFTEPDEEDFEKMKTLEPDEQ